MAPAWRTCDCEPSSHSRSRQSASLSVIGAALKNAASTHSGKGHAARVDVQMAARRGTTATGAPGGRSSTALRPRKPACAHVCALGCASGLGVLVWRGLKCAGARTAVQRNHRRVCLHARVRRCTPNHHGCGAGHAAAQRCGRAIVTQASARAATLGSESKREFALMRQPSREHAARGGVDWVWECYWWRAMALPPGSARSTPARCRVRTFE